MGELLGIVAFVFLVLWILKNVKTSSEKYRSYLVNMLVAGKVRQVAKKEDVDLSKEDKFFKTFCKKSGIDRMNNLDYQLEEELADKLESQKEEEEDKK